ncbi:nuclear receptor coactivator 2 isoform X3 [Nasonia vitripennis]|uniref:Nuclear receptor coactivator 2 n=1 Tax=Nasonia vitripennis TaxID=7425 RepID=A0A7M7INA0_NASVI|nr:nuclear receptor coactivator 2 isoform X3 [Nasonia vitripennis]XP_016837286.1 nuclear receptor coactivator 2 isoform X3 [Nasonia vitripennis]XP_016837288.1 nuclear receptor coactivator 2 isoform X3 [Nasonia vitripennis]XP_016837289.1 nuclear receptor coactivator 2 isoform X3 [Nasonia vitripennis]XP_031779396.1 nuclear receptor coactivator 2 isoform X3 [Nasonia vitripennis]XP_032453111.1 nuclear receptor coactivator 2 isoform X3 [Nasonia vitripennis]XP_032453112.1 nuclear receptor coactivat
MSIAAAENAGPGPCDLRDPLWVKMNAITGITTKKRKKSDAKPQSQINKCLNEKRRRTQENLFIDELAELISATDMSSGKTDKCQILQRTVEQIRHINTHTGSNSHAVQQGEVSSSNPSILSNDQVGPILLEALDGFLFIVNTEGRVEYVTDNITEYINYTKNDVLGKDIYNIIHHGDHNNFMPNILPMSVAGWSSEPQTQTRNRTFECRFLVKPPDDKEETMEEKQQRVSKYETMQICSALLPSNGASSGSERLEPGGGSSAASNVVGGNDVSSEFSDIGPCVMCVARRISFDEKRIGQFTLKLDTFGKIMAVDTNWLSPSYSQYLSNKNLINTKIQDLCHPSDLSKLTAHLKDAIEVGESMSPIYRLHISSEKFLNVQTKSKLFKASVANKRETDFIMATNSIFRDSDLNLEGGQLSNNSKLCSGHSSTRSANNSSNSNGNNNNNVGGPLMSVAGSQLNGQLSSSSPSAGSRSSLTSTNAGTGYPGSSGSDSSSAVNAVSSVANAAYNHFNPSGMDLGFDLGFPHSSLELDSSTPYWACEPVRSESRTSQVSVQSQHQQQQHGPGSRPPSQPNATASSASPAAVVPAHCSSPLRAFSPNAANAFSNSFPFSPLQESQSASLGGASTPSSVQPPQLQHNQPSPMDHRSNGPSQLEPAEQQQQQQQSQPQQQVSTESGRLRNLLTKGSSASDDSCQENASTQPGGGQAGPEADKPSQTNRILKILLNQQDEDDYHSSEHAGPKAMRNSPGQQVQPKHSPHEHKPNVGPSNNMLLQLLNEKNDDDDEETRAGMKKRNELLTQLLKEPEDEKKVLDQKNRDDDPLLRSLGFRNNSPSSSQSDHSSGSVGLTTGQKRPVEDGEMNVAVKRAMDGSQVTSTASSSSSGSSNNPSKLWEKNRMLASLLAKQPTQPATIPPIPASVISATPQDKLPRVLDRSKQQQQQHQQQHQQQQQQQQHQQQQQQPWTSMQSVGSNSTTTTATSARTPMQNQSRQLPRQPTNTYLTHLQQVTKMEQMDSDFMGNRDYRQQGTDPSAWDIQSALDPDLSDILDQVIDIAPEGIADSLLDAVQAQRNERLAINAIQESLMQIETAVNPTSSNITMPGTPPAYSTALANTPVTSSHNYQPPPMYQQPQQQQQARMRLNTQQAGNRQAAAQFSPQQQQQQQLQRKLMQQQQQQMKQRLLQQQQQQQVLISTATATDQITAGIHTLDNLLNNLNNTVAPNVSLQRSSVPDSQVSPSYGGSVQMPQGQHRLTHSYSHPSTLPQHPAVNNSFNSGQQVSAAARLSPHSPAGIMSFSHPQPLSPRVTQQGNYASSPRMFNVNQVRQQQQPGQQPGLQQQQRSMSSPGTPVSARQSPFPAEAFPPPASPTASQFPPVPNSNVTNPSAQYRLQRTTSTPSATTQLPGGVGSPCHYGGVGKEQPLLSPSHPLSGCPATPTHNQHNANNTQHFSNHQHPSMLYHNAAGVQSSQYCYDRTPVNLYQSGPGDAQDIRPPPSSNPASHQIGGNTSSTGGINSEYVRKELRTVVDARMQQQQQQRVPNNLQNNLTAQVSQEDLESLGLTYDMASTGDALVSDGSAKSWAIGSTGTAPSSSRTTMEEVARGDPKSSLLQKLLSE